MPKRLVICCDGTWNSPDQQQNGVPCPSNVTKVALCVAPVDAAGIEQRLFYDKGVGTGRFDRIRGGAFGFGIRKKILDAYVFLIANYDPGDELFFFGFSRGAYTARSTFGLIRNSGLLKREFAGKMDDAYDLYRRRDDASHPTQVEATLFRKTYSHEPGAKFIGVWDTVGALGIPIDGPLRFLDKYLNKYLNKGWQFHDVKLSRSVESAYQALALDEKRKPFQPAVWEQQEGAGPQVLEQVWFAGVHSNVGGSYANTGLSDIAFGWMANRAAAQGLALDLTQLPSPLKPDPLGELRNSQNLFYKLFGGDYIRPVGKGINSNESAASTALERQNDPPSNYRPQNLREYLAGGGTVTRVPAKANGWPDSG